MPNQIDCTSKLVNGVALRVYEVQILKGGSQVRSRMGDDTLQGFQEAYGIDSITEMAIYSKTKRNKFYEAKV